MDYLFKSILTFILEVDYSIFNILSAFKINDLVTQPLFFITNAT